MQFHFLKLTYNDTYLSLVDPNSKSRFVCFAEKDVAMKCLNFSIWTTSSYKTFIRN